MAIIDSSAAWFSFKGVKSDDMKVFMLELPARQSPAESGSRKDVPGTSGGLWVPDEGCGRINVSVQLEAGDGSDIDAINAWLMGEGELIFGDEPNRAYHARIVKASERTHARRRLNRKWKQAFDCEAYRYLFPSVDGILIQTSGTKITNPGTASAKPLIKVTGSGDGTLMIGRATMLLSDMNAPIYLDCEAKMAFTGTGATDDPRVLATQHVTGEWIEIAPGDSFVTFTGGISSAAIAPRWRFF